MLIGLGRDNPSSGPEARGRRRHPLRWLGFLEMRGVRPRRREGRDHREAVMRKAILTAGVVVGCAVLLSASRLRAQDWPQWRGPNRDARATGFKAPTTWPKELKQQWKVTVGEGVATPALVGDRLYVFAREGGNEVLRCLDAA